MRWKGYGPEADTWQPLADLANVQDMIDDFRKSKAEKKGKRKQPVCHFINCQLFFFLHLTIFKT